MDDYQSVAMLSVQGITEDERNRIRKLLSTDTFDSKLTEDELNWLRQVLGEDYYYDPVKLSPAYVRYKKNQFERNEKKEIVRKELDLLRKNMKKFTPIELIELKNKNIREDQGVENFAGIYIIHNLNKNIFYVGQSERVFDRAYKHFITNPAEKTARYELSVELNLPEIYNDYHLGDEFNISLIPLVNTSFSNLDELENYAIAAYNAFVDLGGYNRTKGNITRKVFFQNDYHEEAANLILNKIKETEIFSTLINNKKRIEYTRFLELEFGLSHNTNFFLNFVELIKEYQKANKKRKKS